MLENMVIWGRIGAVWAAWAAKSDGRTRWMATKADSVTDSDGAWRLVARGALSGMKDQYPNGFLRNTHVEAIPTLAWQGETKNVDSMVWPYFHCSKPVASTSHTP